MKYSYDIQGMTCTGCKAKVEKTLLEDPHIVYAEASLKDNLVYLESETQLSKERIQDLFLKRGLHYSLIGDTETLQKVSKPKPSGSGIYYCPMFCEGERTYDQQRDCPVCGMDLVEHPKPEEAPKYSCSNHSEVMMDFPGTCQICGKSLELVLKKGNESESVYRNLLMKFWISLLFTLPVFIIAMSDMFPGSSGWKSIFDEKVWNWVQFVLSLPVIFYAGRMFFKRAWSSVKNRNLNMFTLIGLGSGIAFIFSVVALLFPDWFPAAFKTESGTVHVYFEAVNVILTLALLGQVLESKAHERTSQAIRELMNLSPLQAWLVDDEGHERLINAMDLQKGNQIRIKPGSKIPVDGKIIEGAGEIDESMITGEPLPVSKFLGDPVISGTINGSGSFVMIAEKVGNETMLAHIIDMVSKASRSKSPWQKLADRIAAYFVPLVIVISACTFVVWFFLGPEPSIVYGLINAVAVLIIACPCALGLATPMSVMVGVGKGAQNGILIKDAEALERMNKLDILITDKTGTLTKGEPSLDQVIGLGGYTEEQVLYHAASLNHFSEHPLARAVCSEALKRALVYDPVKDFSAIIGKGVIGKLNDKLLRMGNERLVKTEAVSNHEETYNQISKEQDLGKTVSYISVDGELIGVLVFSDAIKENAKETIKSLEELGMKVIMLSGDNVNTVKAVADRLNLKDFESGCSPVKKMNRIKDLQKQGHQVGMIGDGINDAPALAQSNVGIAMGTGTSAAIESADITLISGDLNGIVKALKLSRYVSKNIMENLFFAFIYNIFGIPIAAGVLYPIFGVFLSPMIAALAMSFSSVSVIGNALRLRKLKLS